MTTVDTLPALAAAWAAYAPPRVSTLRDAQLLESHRTLAEMRRVLDARSAAIAAEISFRSRPELGYDGLAQRPGAEARRANAGKPDPEEYRRNSASRDDAGAHRRVDVIPAAR